MNTTTHIPRRDFLKTAAAGVVAGSAFINRVQSAEPGQLPKRILGRTGEKVSMIGLGGWTIGRVEENEAIKIMHAAIDEGITFFDNSWNYNGGWSEEVMGKALTGSRREKVFLMTKGCGRDEVYAEEHIDISLKQLGTDHIDLWMFHGVAYMDQVPRIFDEKKGAINAALKAQKEGKIRYIGYSCHRSPEIALALLNQGFQFDAAMIPISILDAHFKSFQHEVVPELVRQDVGILGMKALNVGKIPEMGYNASECRRYALSLPISSLVCGIQSWDNFHQDLNMAKNFSPMNEKEVKKLLASSAKDGQPGEHERYKHTSGGCEWQRRKDREVAAG